jgi:uncharacterized membrane protein YqhA
MISIAGMCGINFTETFINAKNTPDTSMDWTLVIFKIGWFLKTKAKGKKDY